jgi:mono/diheme cytochrome c family protein
MRLRRLLRRILLGLACLVLLAAAGVFAGAEWILRRRHDVALQPLPPAPPGISSEEGRRRAVLIGCLQGCHGPDGEGGFEEAQGIFKATAPTLTSVLADYGDAELVRLVRFGVKRDGRSAVGMPSATFYPISDEDLAVIFRHLRERPLLPAVPRDVEITSLGRLALVLGEWKIAADQVDRTIPRWGELPRVTPFERGRYLASVICSECHGLDLKGLDYFPSPTLAVVNGYYPDQFGRLLRTGEHLSGRTDGLMSRVSRAAFREFTDQEIDDLYTYLTVTFVGLPAAPTP